MYKKGDLKLLDPLCETWDAEEEYCLDTYSSQNPHYHSMSDSRQSYKHWTDAAYLPHSCDEWVIGGPVEIRAMIEDLQTALKELEGRE